MGKSTPGPWEFRHAGSDNCTYEVYADAENGDIIAGEYGINDEADARLIASAPNLLDALISCKAKFDEYASIHRMKGKGHEYKAASNVWMSKYCSAAIARARGEK